MEKKIIDKYNHCVLEYNKQDYSFPEARYVKSFIDSNINCIDDSEICLQHGDFHLGNIIIKNGQYAGIIDFNKINWGDPVHDFARLAWFSKPLSLEFAKGQLDGYFENNELKTGFWLRYSLYLAISILGL